MKKLFTIVESFNNTRYITRNRDLVLADFEVIESECNWLSSSNHWSQSTGIALTGEALLEAKAIWEIPSSNRLINFPRSSSYHSSLEVNMKGCSKPETRYAKQSEGLKTFTANLEKVLDKELEKLVKNIQEAFDRLIKNEDNKGYYLHHYEMMISASGWEDLDKDSGTTELLKKRTDLLEEISEIENAIQEKRCETILKQMEESNWYIGEKNDKPIYLVGETKDKIKKAYEENEAFGFSKKMFL